MLNKNKELYEFDKFRLDVAERILWCDSTRIPLSEKAFNTLCVLVRRGNHLVGKDELLNEVWADVIVEENNLDKNISLLRQVLGERAGNGKFIETVRGHGYRFVVEVHKIDDEEALGEGQYVAMLKPLIPTVGQTPINGNQFTTTDERLPSGEKTIGNQQPMLRKRGWSKAIAICSLLVLGFAAVYFWRENTGPARLTQIKTVAILPFRALLGETRNEALEMGITDTLISKLSGSGEITVRPLSSVRRYTALERDSVLAGRELHTEAVLDGSIQTAGERMRISVQLIQVDSGKQLWAADFDEKFTDIFAVQDAIAERVATAMKIRLRDKGNKRYSANVDAYQLYMKGRYHLLKAAKPDTDTSIEFFQQAIKADPNYALAYAGLADAYRARSVGGEMPSVESMPKARAAANKAIEIDDTLAEAHANLGHIYFWYDWDWSAAENQHKRALALDPNNVDALQFYAHMLSNTGRHAEALPKIERARELDPLNLRINALEGLFLLHAGQTDEAIAVLNKTLTLDPNYRLGNIFAARAYIAKGLFAEAVAATRKVRQLSAVSSEPIAFGAYALAHSDKVPEARAALDELLKLSVTRYVPPYNIALIYSGLGEEDKALDYLEMGYEQKDVRMVFLKVEPEWNNLRTKPRFIALMKRMKLD
jgi:TolB-like protein/DNA-binding winged helix-turn-helix (wHTH) protein/Tfp pilus assembly protein PilF